MVLLVRCQHYLLCVILSGSFSLLPSKLTLGVIHKRNILLPNLYDVVLVSSMVVLFSLKICNPDKLCQQMDK